MNDQTTTSATASWPELRNPEQLDKILDIIAVEGGIDRDRIMPDATRETLGLQSMDVVSILMGIEDKLDAYLPMDADMSVARNLAELIGAIDKHVALDQAAGEAKPS